MIRISPALLKASLSYPSNVALPVPTSPAAPERVTLTRTEIKAILPKAKPEQIDQISSALDEILGYADINISEKRITHFLSQIAHETERGGKFEENLSYSSPERMKVVFARLVKYKNEELAPYVDQPEEFANFVYDSRIFPKLGLGNVHDGDGWRFRGRGCFHHSGRAQYNSISEHPLMKRFGVDIVAEPDRLANDMTIALIGCVVFWERNKMNNIADNDDYTRIARKINRGEGLKTDLGIARKKEFLRVKKIILNRAQLRGPRQQPVSPPPLP